MLTQFVTGANFNFQTAPHNLTQTLNQDAGGEISIEDFVLHHLSGNADIDREDLSFSYDSPTKTSTIAFPGLSNSGLTGMLADGNYDLILNDFSIPDLVGESIYSFFHLIADLNHDRAIGSNDFSTLSGNFNQSGDWSDGDITGDGLVNMSDYQILSANYGRQMPVPLTAANSMSCYALSESAIRLNWTAPSSGTCDGFRIFMSTDGIDYTQIAQVGPTTYTYDASSLQDGTKYWFRVQPYTTANGNGASTNETWAPTVLAAPTAITLTANSDGTIDVAWTRNSLTESGFKVERATSSSGSWTEVGQTSGQATAWRDTNAADGTTYYYRVTALAPDTVSAASTTASIASVSLALPTEMTTSVTTDGIELRWQDNSDTETGYRVQKADNSTFTQNLVTVVDLPASSDAYEISGLSENVGAYYRLAPLTSSSVGTYSSFGLQKTLVAAPNDLNSEEQQNGDVLITWDDSSAVETGYRIERADDPDFTTGLTTVGTTSSNAESFTDTTAASGVYSYRVVALASGGVESQSTSDQFASTGIAYRPANPTINLLGETLWTGSYNDAGITRTLYATRPGQPIFFSTREAAAFATNNGSWPTATNNVMTTDYERMNTRLEWNFGDTTSSAEYNVLPGYTAGHVYNELGIFAVTLKVVYPDDITRTDDPSPTTKTAKVFVQVTNDSTATSGTLTSTSPANNNDIPDITYTEIYVGAGNPDGLDDSGDSHSNRVSFGRAVELFELSNKQNVRVFFRADQSTALTQPSPTTVFNLAGANNVLFSQYRGNVDPLRPRARVALHLNVDDTQSIFSFATTTKRVSVSGLEISVDASTRALRGRVADIKGKNVAFRDLKLTRMYLGFEIASGLVSGSNQTPTYQTAEGVLIQDVNKRKMANGSSGALTNVAYDDPTIVTGQYFAFANPGTRGLILLGNKSGETTEAIAAKDRAKDHNTRTYASDVLMFHNTFSNRAAIVNGEPNKDVYTFRANKGKFIYWSENTTYGGATLLGRVGGDGIDASVHVQFVVIERNRFLQDPRDNSGTILDTSLPRLELSSQNQQSGQSNNRLVSHVMIRNNYFENGRGIDLDQPPPNATAGFRPSLVSGPQEVVHFVHNTFVHKQNEDVSASPPIQNQPWLRLRRQLNGTNSLNVLRGNLFVSQQSAATASNTQNLVDTNYDYTAAGQFLSGQVLDNVFPNEPTNTSYRFSFNGSLRTFSGSTGWQNKFSDDEQLTVALDSAFKPGASPNVTNAAHVNVFFGMVVDLFGTARSETDDTWTKGAVQR